MTIGNYRKPEVDSSTDAPSVGVGAPSAGGSMVDPSKIPAGRAGDPPDVTVKEKPPTPASSLVDALERGMQRDVNELAAVTAPIKPYKDKLAEEGITLDQARRVLDALLLHGSHYSEDVKISPNLLVRFRTRQYLDTMRTYQAIEREAPHYADSTAAIQVRYMLAASLEAYGARTFTFPATTDIRELDAAFEERLSFLYTLSDFTVRLLAREFGKFDRKLTLILSDGAVEAF